MDETNDDMPIPVDPRDAEIANLKAKLAEAAAYIEATCKDTAIGAAARAFAGRPPLPTGGIHTASTLAGGNVDHPPRTRDEGRIHVTDQY